ncbi:MAG: FecCD family ABC transporter permease [Desulfovibrio sp.]
MHFDHGTIPEEYTRYLNRKYIFLGCLFAGLLVALVAAVSFGAAVIPLDKLFSAFLEDGTSRRYEMIVWNIRLPQAVIALVAGAGLACSGAVMQCILRNPLGSPFTLGISHAAAFGAAFAVMVLDQGSMTSTGGISVNNPYVTTGCAFAFSLLAAGAIIGVSRLRTVTPEVMVLTGVALSALFTAGTMLLQYFADDVQLAAMVFWTFGDTGRADWAEVLLMTIVTVTLVGYFLSNCWKYNAMEAGDETAQSLGVRVGRVRLTGMMAASLLTAVLISFLGIIGFVGLVVPHMIRRVLGADHRFLLVGCVLCGGGLLLVSDTVARLILSPHVLPVSVLTAFMGAPIFIYLIIQGGRR